MKLQDLQERIIQPKPGVYQFDKRILAPMNSTWEQTIITAPDILHKKPTAEPFSERESEILRQARQTKELINQMASQFPSSL